MQTRSTMTSAAAAVLAAAALAALSTPGLAAPERWRPDQGAGPARTSLWDTFSVDITTRQTVVDANGQPAGPAAPRTVLRLERRQEHGRWRTTMTVVDREAPVIQGPISAGINPFEVVRVEYDENGKPPRLYDRQGRLVGVPGEAERRLFRTPAALAAGLPALGAPRGGVPPAPVLLTGQDWITAIVAPVAGRSARRAALERQLGRPTGQVRGLDRYAGWLGTDALEVLVDPVEALPVEINRSRDGELVAHATLAHTRAPDGTITGRAAHLERRLAGGSGERAITDVELTNIRLSAGGAQ